MGETFSKREKQKQKIKAKQDKAQKMKERKENGTKKSFEDMLAYLDENGNLSATPPDPRKMKTISVDDISLSVSRQPVDDDVDTLRTGVVTFFNEAKGFGFIEDAKNKESVFVHVNQAKYPLKERDKVTFEVEHNARGASAVNVQKAT